VRCGNDGLGLDPLAAVITDESLPHEAREWLPRARGQIVDLNSFMRELTRVRTLVERFHRRLQAEAAPQESPLAETVAELGTALEGLRVTEEELRVQTDTLVAAQEQLAAQRERYRELFESAPAP
jgi:hypothetical protein